MNLIAGRRRSATGPVAPPKPDRPSGPVAGHHWTSAWLWSLLAMLPVVVIRAGKLAESDTFWEIRTGLVTLQQRALPSVDPFSWTMGGRPWRLNSWGFDVVVALVYRLLGLPGVAVACAALVMVTSLLVLVLAQRLGASPLVTGFLLMFSSPLLISWYAARPQLVDYLAVLALMLVLVGVVERPTYQSMLLTGTLTLLWVNLHAGAVLGLAIIGCFAVFSLSRPSTRPRGRVALGLLGAAVTGSLVNPYGVGLFAQTLDVKNASTAGVAEWHHLDPTHPLELVTLSLGVAALVLAVRRRDTAFTAALVVAALGSLTAVRMLPVLLLLALPVLARELSSEVVVGYLRSRRAVWVTGMVAVAAVAVQSLSHLGRPDADYYPSDTVIQAIPAGCKVFNSYLLGGYLVLKRPDVTVSMDSRNDLYGEERLVTDHATIEGDGDIEQRLSGADCVLVPPATGLADHLHSDSDWSFQGAERSAALFVRR